MLVYSILIIYIISSYSTTSFIGYELVDLNTGERQLQDWLAQSNALLTKNYIITCPVSYELYSKGFIMLIRNCRWVM
jgi:hypothetical protein